MAGIPRALKNHVLLNPIPDYPDQVVNGLTIPAARMQGTPKRGTIMSVGENVEGIKVGDMVVFNEYKPRVIREYEAFAVHKDKILALIHE